MARLGARFGPSSMKAEWGRRLGCLLISGGCFRGKTPKNQDKGRNDRARS
jgi:hypothetical protein